MNSRQAKLSTHKRGYLTLTLVSSLLALVALLLYVSTTQRYEDFVDSQQALMKKSAQDTAQTIQLYIEQTRRTVRLFAAREQDNIRALSLDPDNQHIHEEIEASLALYLPDYATFTIADTSGTPLIDDFGGMVGNICRKDISTFAETDHPRKLVIHPNPEQYHFDVMAPVQLQGGTAGVFFVSFKPGVLSKLLANSELHGHEIMLLHSNKKGLIELSAGGTRDILARESVLTDDELAKIDVSYDVPESLWEVVYIPNLVHYSNMQHQMRSDAVKVFLVVLVISLIMMIQIRRKEISRKKAEQVIEESNEQLETRVNARTNELYRANT